MKIAVLNGSPKGRISVTMQYVHFLELKFPDTEFQLFDVAQKIKKLEEDEGAFQETIRDISAADAVLWAFPLYFFLVSSQYKRFIELIFERGAASAFHSKPAAVLTTSIHFFDHTAHNYLSAICDDLGMKLVGSYSAEMNDLHRSSERKRLRMFGQLFIDAVHNGIPTIKGNKPLTVPVTVYAPARPTPVATNGKKVLIVVDDLDEDSNLHRMVENLQMTFSPRAELVQLKEVDIKGGCLGCLQCGLDNVCIYQGKDEFIDFFNRQVKAADILFIAGSIRDRFLSSLWKCFFDRSFFNGHIPVLESRQIGFVISGPLGQVQNLREILAGYVGMQHANLVGFVSDDIGSSAEIDAALQGIAVYAVRCERLGYVQPPTFYQVGGGKIFRDAIWSRLRFVFQADHKYFKERGFYDFPRRGFRWWMTSGSLIVLTKIPFLRREFIKRVKEEMIKPYVRILNRSK